jgi:hypothetical protein
MRSSRLGLRRLDDRLSPLPPHPADTGVTDTVRANNRFRVRLDTNRYSVPSRYASRRLTLKTFADRLCIYDDHQLIATHTRSYDRYPNFEHPDHTFCFFTLRHRTRFECVAFARLYRIMRRDRESSIVGHPGASIFHGIQPRRRQT